MSQYSFTSDERSKAVHDLAIITVKSKTYLSAEELTEDYIKNVNKILKVFSEYKENNK